MKAIYFFTLAGVLILSCNNPSSNKGDHATASPELEQKDAVQGEVSGTILGNKNGATFFQETTDKEKQTPPDRDDKADKKRQQPVSPAPTIDWDKKIIKTATLDLEVKDYEKYYPTIREKVKAAGGYVAQEEQTQSEYKIENTMVIKVPVDQFDNTLLALASSAMKVNQRKVSSVDVTAEMIDTKARIEAKKQVRQRYMGLLNQAKNMEEILNVQSQVNGIQEEIEAATGRVDYLAHSADFSTINLTYFQVLNATAVEKGKEKEPSFGDRVKSGFAAGWDIVSNFFIILVTIWPLLLASLLVYILYKRVVSHKPKQA